MIAPTIIYEIDFNTDPGISDEFESWLGEHIRSMLQLPGFLSATLYSVDTDGVDGRHRYTIHYLLESHAAMEQTLGEHAAATHQAGIERFGEQFAIDHRVLTESALPDGSVPGMHCKNCDAPIRGQYCANCGQRSQARVITLWEMTRDIVGDIADLDSRVWRSLVPLLVRPGRLTVDYLRGRRARYMPPFRMYLVLSILFFLLLSLLSDQKDMFLINAENDTDEARLEIARDALTDAIPENPEAAKQLRQVRDSLTNVLPSDVEKSATAAQPAEVKPVTQKCDDIHIDSGDFSWITQKEIEARVTQMCRKVVSDNGKSLAKGMLENIPKMLFIFLPLIALVLKGLYPLSRRYYVEHLLFVIHFHAFVFLALSLEMLLAELAVATSLPTWPLTTVLVLYISWYLYRAMRLVYAQGRLATVFKYVLLLFSYFFSLLMTVLATLAFTAFTL